MSNVIVAAFSLLGGAGIISGLVLQRISAINKKLDRQEDDRIKESVVIIRGIKAVGHLAEATAIAQRDGHTNGEMKTALEYYTNSKDDLNDFLLQQAAERTHSTRR